jgi:hypothetical protein
MLSRSAPERGRFVNAVDQAITPPSKIALS